MTVHGRGYSLAKLRTQKQPFSWPPLYSICSRPPFANVPQFRPNVVTKTDFQVG